MSNKYRYDHGPKRNRKRHAVLVAIISIFIVAVLAITILVLLNATTNKIKLVSGPDVQVGVVKANPTDLTKVVEEPLYRFNMPTDWKMTKSTSSASLNSISWQSTLMDFTNRYLTIYSDPIPATYPVNKELPLIPHGSTISFGSLSDNCSDFTDVGATKSTLPVLAKWQNVDFYCNVPNYVDNQIGTGSTGAINSVTLQGQNTGTHHFFFLYIDRNSSPDYTIFYSMLNSFQAK